MHLLYVVAASLVCCSTCCSCLATFTCLLAVFALNVRIDLQMTSLIERKDPNTRFIALSTLCTLCETADMASALQPVLPQVVGCLSDSDPGVKKRAIDLLVNVCDQSSVEQVSAQLLRQLPLASAEVRGELVVKVAILAERYAPSLSWYVNRDSPLSHLLNLTDLLFACSLYMQPSDHLQCY